jgi:hypothetical protein
VPKPPQPFQLARALRWPGGGVQLTLISAPGRTDWPESSKLRMSRADGSELALERAPLSEASGLTALVIKPASDANAHAALLEAAKALVEALPNAERVGVWLGSGELPLISELTEQREHVLARLAAIAPRSDALAEIDRASLDALQNRLGKVGGPYQTASRTLVSIGDPPEAVVGSDAVAGVRLGRVSDDANDAFAWDSGSAADAGRALAAALARSREQAFRVGACGVEPGDALELELGEQRIAATVPVDPSDASPRCDAAAAARDAFPLPRSVRLQMDAAQLAEHDRLAAAMDESDFSVSVAFGDGEAIPARAHFRGQTSLQCDRKSYSVHFTDNEERRFTASAHANEFILLSLCWDKGWFRQVLANRLLAKLGMFPLQQRYVTLRVGDREHGVYLLVEKPDEGLRRRQAALAGLIRRRNDALGEAPESSYPKPEREPDLAEQAVGEYQQLIAQIDALAPSALYDALSARLDLDAYLRWLALMTYFQCGDYVDEVFFYASDEAAASGWYFRTLGWDADDLFSACHHEGMNALADPHGILYCAEGKLDRALLVSPQIYGRFAKLLQELMAAELAEDQISRELSEIHDELVELLSEDAICAGTGLVLDDQPASCAKLGPWLNYEIDQFVKLTAERASLLRERLSALDAAP